MKKRTKADFNIKQYYDEWYAFIHNTDLYLLTSGKVMNWYTGLNKNFGSSGINNQTAFNSEQDVNKAIKIYLQSLAKRRKVYNNSAKPI